MTWQAYGETLEEKLKDLHARVHRGSYRARPARRTYITKADGSERPLSILCLEDKIVQQAVVFVLEAIYEVRLVRHALSAARESQPLHVADLCHTSSIEERNLRHALKDVFNMSPARYLKLQQLNKVRECLLSPDARGRLVTDILVSRGVTELDRFATEYRLLFDETPSETLRRHSPAYNCRLHRRVFPGGD